MSLVSYRSGGFRGYTGDPSAINATTIWTSSTGYLNTPGIMSNGYQFQPQVTSVYDVPGLLLPAPACTQANAGAYVSAACVDQALAVEQQNFQRTADYNAGILKLPLGAPPVRQDPIPAAGYIATPPAAPSAPSTPTPAPVSPASTPAASPIDVGGYVDAATSFFSGTYPIDGFNVPIWGLAAAGLAALFLLKGGR